MLRGRCVHVELREVRRRGALAVGRRVYRCHRMLLGNTSVCRGFANILLGSGSCGHRLSRARSLLLLCLANVGKVACEVGLCGMLFWCASVLRGVRVAGNGRRCGEREAGTACRGGGRCRCRSKNPTRRSTKNNVTRSHIRPTEARIHMSLVFVVVPRPNLDIRVALARLAITTQEKLIADHNAQWELLARCHRRLWSRRRER